MRVLLAGGTGVIGRPLIPQLVAAGHSVVATTRDPARASLLHRLGAQPAVMDALDPDAVHDVVLDVGPDAIVDQLTALPREYAPARASFYELTNRLRTEATRSLLEVAAAAGVSRFVFQSIAFLYAPAGPPVLTEDAPAAAAAPAPFGDAVRSVLEGERMVLESPGIEGVVLRYGQLYGPGTYFDRDGYFGRQARRRMLPVVGKAGGMFSFLHVEDAASAAVAALERGRGVYNVADDEPATAREWIPVYCEAVGAPPPLRVPAWLARVVAGRLVVDSLMTMRAVSNARAKAQLAWAPSHPSWRAGFREALGAGPGEHV